MPAMVASSQHGECEHVSADHRATVDVRNAPSPIVITQR